MRTRTLAALEDDARQLADTVNDAHVTSALAIIWINQGIAELWRKLVNVYPDRYTLRATFSTTAGTAAYDMADVLTTDDFMAVRRVDLLVGSQRIPIEPFALQEAPYHASDPTNGYNGRLTRYRIIGQGIDGTGTQIYFDPDPGTNTFAIWYVQAPQLLVADDDVFDGIAGCEDWVVCYAAMRMCIRQETDHTPIMAEMARIESSILSAGGKRDVGRAPQIADVRPRGIRR
jgi:hypothetical protein